MNRRHLLHSIAAAFATLATGIRLAPRQLPGPPTFTLVALPGTTISLPPSPHKRRIYQDGVLIAEVEPSMDWQEVKAP